MSISPKNEASHNNTAKRRDYISWDEYFMGIAMLSAMRSKDPNSQVGACIVRDNKILSLGYNGMPIGCDDVKRIVYLDDKYRNANNNVAARHMFKIAGVETKKYEPSARNISLNL